MTPFPRECIRCNKRFQPSTNKNKICNNCFKKSIKGRKKAIGRGFDMRIKTK